MSDFSNYFQECIRQNHLNVSQLARQSGIHRTLIQKIMTGARLPAQEQMLTKILPFMMLSLRQQETLLDLYHIEKMGKDKYHQHMIIKSFIEHLQINPNIKSPMLNLKVESQPCADTYCIYDKYSLIQCISSALGRLKLKNNPKLYLLMQDIDSSVYDFIASSLYGQTQVLVKHLLCFQSAETESNIQMNFNIHLCQSITPLLLCGCDYHPMCYYHSNAIDQSYYAPYPYVFLTDDCVINFSADLSGAIITHHQPIINQFQTILNKREQVSHPITKHYHEPLDILQPYIEGIESISNHAVYSFMQAPCILPLLTYEQIATKIRRDVIQTTQFDDLVFNYMNKLHKLEHIIIYFTRNGLTQFMNTGYMSEVPNNLYHPFTVKERLDILKTMMEAIHEGKYSAHLINDSFSFHKDLSITAYSENRIIFRYGIDANGTSFLFNELSFGTMMVSFFEQMIQSNLVESEEATTLFIHQLYHQYQTNDKKTLHASCC